MEFQGFPKIARLSREMVITEKLDGTNAQVYIAPPGTLVPVDKVLAEYLDGSLLLAGSRGRYITPVDDNFGFAQWVEENAEGLIKLGPGRHFGEWYGRGINRGYGLADRRFALFNVSRWEDVTTRPACCGCVPVLYRGEFDTAAVAITLRELERVGSLAVPGYMNPEGIIIYHTAANVCFKKTLEGDEKGKEREKHEGHLQISPVGYSAGNSPGKEGRAGY